MTQPTQAQIEAANKLIYRFEHESMALHHIQRDWLVKEIAALAAAAQVGEQKQEVRHIILTQDATIERCAQVVERYAANIGEVASTIAAELRQLKDAL